PASAAGALQSESRRPIREDLPPPTDPQITNRSSFFLSTQELACSAMPVLGTRPRIRKNRAACCSASKQFGRGSGSVRAWHAAMCPGVDDELALSYYIASAQAFGARPLPGASHAVSRRLDAATRPALGPRRSTPKVLALDRQLSSER